MQGNNALFSTQPTFVHGKKIKKKTRIPFISPPSPPPPNLTKPHDRLRPNPHDPLYNYFPPLSVHRAYMNSHVILPSSLVAADIAD